MYKINFSVGAFFGIIHSAYILFIDIFSILILLGSDLFTFFERFDISSLNFSTEKFSLIIGFLNSPFNKCLFF